MTAAIPHTNPFLTPLTKAACLSAGIPTGVHNLTDSIKLVAVVTTNTTINCSIVLQTPGTDINREGVRIIANIASNDSNII